MHALSSRSSQPSLTFSCLGRGAGAAEAEREEGEQEQIDGKTNLERERRRFFRSVGSSSSFSPVGFRVIFLSSFSFASSTVAEKNVAGSGRHFSGSPFGLSALIDLEYTIVLFKCVCVCVRV